MFIIKGKNINQIQLDLFQAINEKGKSVNVRNSSTKEIYPVYIELINPLNRLTTLHERKWNLPFAVGELAWHLKGSNEFDFISYYSRNWSIALEEGDSVIRESCYGSQIFTGNFSIWQRLLNEFNEDINTRRAVISLYDSNKSLGLNHKDVACTSTIQFLVRDNKLDCIVNMRSNDIIWGLPNDIFFVSLIQELLSKLLKVKLGSYFHNVGSLHIYDRHYELMKSILENPSYIEFEMPQMEEIDLIPEFLTLEEFIREGQLNEYKRINGYWGDLLDIIYLRSKNISNELKHKLIENSKYKKVLKLCAPNYIFSENLLTSLNFD